MSKYNSSADDRPADREELSSAMTPSNGTTSPDSSVLDEQGDSGGTTTVAHLDGDSVAAIEGLEQEEAATALPKRQRGVASFANSVRRKRYISAYRDAKTLRRISDLRSNPAYAGNDTLLVSESIFTPPSRRFYKTARVFEPWWSESWRPDLPAPARQYRTPAPWRDISDYLKVTMRHVALKTFGSTMSFTLNLSPEIEELTRAQSSPSSWLQKRIGTKLNAALDRVVEFHMVLEEADRGHRLHVHGEIQMEIKERHKARPALRGAGGKWDAEAEGRQLWLRIQPDVGWANYLVKDFGRVDFTRKVVQRRGITVSAGPVSRSLFTLPGNYTASTDLLDKKAREIYEAHLDLM